tara:strand:- start:48 stop:842 length:795 start_codon:yes stop_codon:yes gene_type:complete
MADVNKRTTARRKLADQLKALRKGGMTREQMIGREFDKGTGPKFTGDELGFEREEEGDEETGVRNLTERGSSRIDDFINKLYTGNLDTLADKRAQQKQGRQDFRQQYKSRELERVAKVEDGRAQLKKQSAAKFGVAHEVYTPRLDNLESMQGDSFGGHTALAGSVGSLSDASRRVSSDAAQHASEARRASNRGDRAGESSARTAEAKSRRERGSNILTQEARNERQKQDQKAARVENKKRKATRRDARDANRQRKQARRDQNNN